MSVDDREEPEFPSDGRRGQQERGWLRDHADREYRTVAGGAVRVYHSGLDRDAAVDESYRLSPPVLLIFEAKAPVAALVAAHVGALAELYFAEASSYRGVVEHRLADWTVRHFGRRLERSAEGILAFELRDRLAPSEGGHARPGRRFFRDYREELQWIRAANEVHTQAGAEERLRLIARAVGVEIGPGPQPMPDVPEASEQRRAELVAAAREPGSDG